MIRFFAKLLLFGTLSGIPFFYLSYKKAIHNSDYWKATCAATHLVIGTSEAHQGIDPSVLENTLELAAPMLNIAFNGITSPYGAKYFNFIKRKIATSPAQDGIFIVSVSPGTISSNVLERYPAENDFRVYDMWNVNIHPNLEYIARNPGGVMLSLKKINKFLRRKKLIDKMPVSKRRKKLEGNGGRGREEKRPNKEERRAKREQKPKLRSKKAGHKTNGFIGVYISDEDIERVKVYQKQILTESEVKAHRVLALGQIVTYLRSKGTVFLVRMPMAAYALTEQADYLPNFDSDMMEMAVPSDVFYLNYLARAEELNYNFHDNLGHLEARSAAAFSELLAKDIKAILE